LSPQIFLKGDIETINWDDLGDINRNKTILIDLRNKDELDTAGGIKGGLHIPLNELRQKLPELNKEKNYIPFCAVGLRGYLGHRILIQNGIQSKNLGGGYKTYLGAKEKIMKESPHTHLWLGE